MANHSTNQRQDENEFQSQHLPSPVDYSWFASRFEDLLERFVALETTIETLEQNLASINHPRDQAPAREYYSVPEFAELVGRGEYTVREWCRMERINAEKCETGRGDAKSWKIPADELARYRDHGLLPTRYLR